MAKFAALVGFTVMGTAAVAAISLFLALPVKWCWNYAVPDLFHLPEITFGKAWCLMWLCSSFFKASLSCKHDCGKS